MASDHGRTSPAGGVDSIAPSVSVIVLTMGDRGPELQALVDSLADQQPFEGVLIGNGVEPTPFPGWRVVALAENVGISAGRAKGATVATGDVLVFLDDDARCITPDLIAQVRSAFADNADRRHDDHRLGALALRVVVEGTEVSLSEWLPRVRGAGEHEPGPVTSFSGAAHAVERATYELVGGYADNFWYSHEETDLAWRILDSGRRIDYRPDLTVSHPLTKPSRHRNHLWYSARNRVWLARKHLPLPVALLYLACWLAIQLARCRSRAELAGVLSGTREGFTASPGVRRPISWRTVLWMTRLGRPPII